MGRRPSSPFSLPRSSKPNLHSFSNLQALKSNLSNLSKTNLYSLSALSPLQSPEWWEGVRGSVKNLRLSGPRRRFSETGRILSHGSLGSGDGITQV